MRKLSLIAILILTCVYLFYFENKRESQEVSVFTSEATNYGYVPNGNGLAYGIVTDDHKQIIDNRVFNLKKDDDLKLNFMVGTKGDFTAKFMLKALLNYETTAMQVNGAKKDEISFTLHENEIVIPTISFSEFHEGINDLILLLIRDPDTTDTSFEYRSQTEYKHIITFRLTVNVESDLRPEIQMEKLPLTNTTILTGVLLSNDTNLRQWLTEDITNKDKLDFYMHVGNKTIDDKATYAVVTLNNWSQVTFRENKNVIFMEVPKNSMVSIKSQLSLDQNTDRVSNITTLLIPFPYEPVDQKKFMVALPSARVALINNNKY